MKKIISTDKAPKAIGPYSQGVLSGDTLFLAGQIAIDPESGRIEVEDPAGQTRRVIENLRAVLQAAGMGLENVVKTTIYLTSMENFRIVNEVYSEFFSDSAPARATVEVAKLPLGALVEIEAIAER
jgi:2-iminobutanoate/2-iminopropanoate deaminase